MNTARWRRRFLWLLKHTLNRATTRMARTGYGPFSLIVHRGRKSGRTFTTPVVLARTSDGFIAELTYGEKVDWYRNVVASGGCTVVHGSNEYHIAAIEPCDPDQGRHAFPAPARLVLSALRRRDFRLLRIADGSSAAPNRG